MSRKKRVKDLNGIDFRETKIGYIVICPRCGEESEYFDKDTINNLYCINCGLDIEKHIEANKGDLK